MKKLYNLLLMLILIFSMMTACSPDLETDISSILDIDISSGTITNLQDSHGGFHGDGQLFLKIIFTDDVDTLESEIENNDLWKPIPLSENLSTLIYGFESDTKSIGAHITDGEFNPLFPNIENGYYFFKDRSSESENPSDDSEVLNRFSVNFTIAIYDKDTKTIYYAEKDT